MNLDTHNPVSFFNLKTEQNHQQPGRSLPVEVISDYQQGCHFCAAPTAGIKAKQRFVLSRSTVLDNCNSLKALIGSVPIAEIQCNSIKLLLFTQAV